MKVKERNEDVIQVMKNECQSMVEENDQMRTEVKTSKRQNKLLSVALTKAEVHEESLQDHGNKIKVHKNEVIKSTILQPELNLSPFLPLNG